MPTTPISKAIEQVKREFDEKYTQTEGCQAGSEDCGKVDKTTGQYICQTCERWGGPEGELKDWARSLATSKEVKSFFTSHAIPRVLDAVIEMVNNTKMAMRAANKSGSEAGWG